MTTIDHELPASVSGLIALARVAHREGDKALERAVLDKLAREYGMKISFPCCDSVDADAAKGAAR